MSLTDKEMDQLHILSVSAHALLPLVQEKKELAYIRLLQHFREHKEANLGLVAQCNAYTELIEDINVKLDQYQSIKEK